MKTKLLFLLLFMGIMISISNVNAYTKDPTLCEGMKASWDATARKFTLTMLKQGIKEPWACWLTDVSWCNTCYVDITPYGTFVPGGNTYTSSKLDAQYGDPTKGGTNGASSLSVAITSVNNTLPKPKPEDCSQAFSFVTACSTPVYCTNFDAKANGSIITLKGINNCVADNQYMVANADFSLWASLSPTYPDLTNRDMAQADVKSLKYYNSSESVYPFKSGIKVYMSSDDKGGGTPGRGPKYCNKSFDLPVTVGIEEVGVKTLSIYPNPALTSETVTVKGEFSSDSRVSINSLNGTLIGAVISTVGQDHLSLSLSSLNLQAGIYILRIESGDVNYIAKLSIR
jgi:Secretion system C-terminal sorting domain